MVLLFGAVLGGAGCSSSGAPAPGKVVGTPTGTVTVKSGGKVVCVITLDKNGTGTCKVSTAGYPPGKVTFTGAYGGDSKFNAGRGSTTVTLLPAKPAGPAVPSAGASAS
jgi:hypothetical protein